MNQSTMSRKDEHSTGSVWIGIAQTVRHLHDAPGRSHVCPGTRNCEYHKRWLRMLRDPVDGSFSFAIKKKRFAARGHVYSTQ